MPQSLCFWHDCSLALFIRDAFWFAAHQGLWGFFYTPHHPQFFHGCTGVLVNPSCGRVKTTQILLAGSIFRCNFKPDLCCPWKNRNAYLPCSNPSLYGTEIKLQISDCLLNFGCGIVYNHILHIRQCFRQNKAGS